MKKIKACLVLLALVFVASTLFGCTQKQDTGASGETITWKLAYIRPEGTRTDASAKYFAEEVEKQTNGRIKIELYPNSELGDYSLVQERVSMGDVEMQLASVGQTVDKTLGVQTAPYVVSDWAEARKLYNINDGVVAGYVAERLEKQNIKLLAVYPQYFGSICLSKEPINPKDPNSSKNLKVRVPSTRAWEELGKGLGFMTTPLPASEIFTSLQTGIVEGAIGGGSESYYTQYKELVNCVMPIKTHFECHWLYINKDIWDKMSPEDQEIVQSIANQVEKLAFDQAEKEDKKYDELFIQDGIEVYDFTDEEIKAYADKIRREVWPKIEAEYGKEIFDRIKKEVGIN